MHLFKTLKAQLSDRATSSRDHASSSTEARPPEWAAAPEISHTYGKWNEAPEEEYEAAEEFCRQYAVHQPALLPSYAIDKINALGCKAWGLEHPTSPRFVGSIQDDIKGGPAIIRVQSENGCKDVCILSDLPLMAGLYDIQGKFGVYYEVLVHRMDGIIAIGTSCRPYPAWRLPGWNRLSAGLHLDDFRKFFEDPDGGRDYVDSVSRINPGDTIGCGYEFATGTLFYTYNGLRLPSAFTGIYMPRIQYDVFAAIGIEGVCDFEVNFGGEYFRWKEGNEWAWRVEGHVGRIAGGPHDDSEELPSYMA